MLIASSHRGLFVHRLQCRQCLAFVCAITISFSPINERFLLKLVNFAPCLTQFTALIVWNLGFLAINLTPSVGKKHTEDDQKDIKGRDSERIWDIRRKVPVETNSLVCPLFTDSGSYHSCRSYHFRGKPNFLMFFRTLLCQHPETRICAIIQPSQPFLFASWETDQWGQQDHRSSTGGVGLLRYGSTLAWHVPNKCQRGCGDEEPLK